MIRAMAVLLALALAACGDASESTATRVAGSTAASGAEKPRASAPNPASATNASRRYAQDDPGEAGLTLPVAIARGLGTDELVLSCPAGTRDGVSQFAPDWVGVRRLDLDDDGRPDWIVNGRHPCLRQPDAAYWWLYADAAAGQRVLLRAEPAATLEILPTRSRGFRDLRIHLLDGRGAALITDSRYDGQAYVQAPRSGAETPQQPGTD